MKKTILLLFIFVLIQHVIRAQCPPFPAVSGCGFVTADCMGIDGYCNTLSEQIGLTEPLPGCGGTAVLNNDDWIAFFANSTMISIIITPSNCVGGSANIGIQAGLFASCEENGGVNGDGLPGTPLSVQCVCMTTPFNLSSNNFIVGETYYLVVDGCGADICDYEIAIVEGSTTSFEITEPTTAIQGDTSFCSGDIATFSIDSVENATYYFWTADSTINILNGQGTTTLEIAIESEGNFEICVLPMNGCYNGTQSCISINSSGENLESIHTAIICEGDSIEFEGQFFRESGEYYFVYKSSNDCDSIVTLVLETLPTYSETFDTIIEQGGFYHDMAYESDTSIIEYYMADNGCDSIVTIHIIIETDAIRLPPGLSQFALFPNPAFNQFFIQLDIVEPVNFQLNVYDTFGKRTTGLSQSGQLLQGKHLISQDASKLVNGVYFIHFQTKKGIIIKRMVIAR